MKAKMSHSTKITVTIVNLIIILLALFGMILLSLGVKNAETTGTFGIFGKSFHLNQSAAMSPLIEKNELIVVDQKPPTSFKQGDIIAYYAEQDGKDFLLVRKLLLVDGTNYILVDGDNNESILTATETRFLGTVEARSATLGKAVQFLQSEDGRSMFFWWTIGILLFVLGFIILVHVILGFLRVPAQSAQIGDSPEPHDPLFTAPAAEGVSEQAGLDFNQIMMEIKKNDDQA